MSKKARNFIAGCLIWIGGAYTLYLAFPILLYWYLGYYTYGEMIHQLGIGLAIFLAGCLLQEKDDTDNKE